VGLHVGLFATRTHPAHAVRPSVLAFPSLKADPFPFSFCSTRVSAAIFSSPFLEEGNAHRLRPPFACMFNSLCGRGLHNKELIMESCKRKELMESEIAIYIYIIYQFVKLDYINPGRSSKIWSC
jgi:hypothetical protein